MTSDLTVLQSFPVPRSTTNPYLVMLAEHLRLDSDVKVLNFSWRTALLNHYDVFHVHWPEIMVTGPKRIKKSVRQVLFVLLLCRLRLQKIPIVRTQHNVGLPEGLTHPENFLLRLFERQTTLVIKLNPQTSIDPAKPCMTIPHGHYKDWFDSFPTKDVIPGRYGYAGLIRRYKGIEGLLQAFRGTAALEDGLSLRLSGKPSSDKMRSTLETHGADDQRVILDLRFMPDLEFVEAVTSSELVVLPYRSMHNSGSLLAALSLNRPVLVPDNAVNRELAAEVGPGWVFFFEGELTAQAMVATLVQVRCAETKDAPDLSARAWTRTATDHVVAYRKALTVSRPGKETR